MNTQHLGENMAFEAHLMAFLHFNVLETWRKHKLITNLGILNYF